MDEKLIGGELIKRKLSKVSGPITTLTIIQVALAESKGNIASETHMIFEM